MSHWPPFPSFCITHLAVLMAQNAQSNPAPHSPKTTGALGTERKREKGAGTNYLQEQEELAVG